jgi:hypothetical protein
MTRIEVVAIMEYADGREDTFGGETGTAEFYMVKHSLEKQLGEHFWYYNHDVKDTFIIEAKDNNHNTNQLVNHIKNIYQAFDKNRHLKFEIIRVE